MKVHIAGNECCLLPEKGLWLPESATLVVSDLHMGKIEHFRNAGIGIPYKARSQTLRTLQSLVNRLIPRTVIFLGDLFHSVQNQSYTEFMDFTTKYNDIAFILVSGNHDIMSVESYTTLKLTVKTEMQIENLWFTHEPQEVHVEGKYNVSGHIHPAIKLSGAGRQKLTLPCFYIGPSQAILPAFGYFTGKAVIKPVKNSIIFAIADDKIIPIATS